MTIGIITIALAISFTPVTQDKSTDKQRAAVSAHWKQLFDGEMPALEHTTHFLIVAAAATPASRLSEIGAGFEARYTVAAKALKLEADNDLWAGKLTIYLIPTRTKFNSFVRTVAKQQPSADEVTVTSLKGNAPFIAAGSGTKSERGPDVHAGDQIAAAMILQHGGSVVPAWLVDGFGQATTWRTIPTSAKSDRAAVKKTIRGKTAADVWEGKLTANDASLLRASLADFLAYGPANASFPQLVGAYKPSANTQPVSNVDALKAIAYTPDRLTQEWHLWVARDKR